MVTDTFRENRVKAFFCLDDASEIENDSIFNYLMSFRDESPLSVMICLKLLGDLMKKYNLVWNYVATYTQVLLFIIIIRNWYGSFIYLKTSQMM